MAQFLRPISDITVGGWTATPLWSKLSETVPDDATTEIQSAKNPTNDQFEVRLSTPGGIPANRQNHVLRVRCYSNKSGYIADISLVQGTTVIQTFAGQAVPTPAYGTLALTITEANAQNITDYSNLRVRVNVNGGQGGYAWATWTELQLPDALIAKSGSASVSGGGGILATIRKAALFVLLLTGAGTVAVTGQEIFRAAISGGGSPVVVGKKAVGIAGTQTDDFSSYGAGSTLPNPPYEPYGVAPRVYAGGIGVSSGFAAGRAIDTRIPENRYSRVQVKAVGTAIGDRVDFLSRVDTVANSRLFAQVGKAGSGVGLYFAKLINGNTVEQIEDLTVTWAAGDTVLWESSGDSHAIYISGVKRWSYTTTDLPTGKAGFGVFGQYGGSRVADDYFAFYVISPVDGSISGGGAVLGAARKGATGIAAVSGGGNVYVWSEDHYGSVTVSGKGLLVAAGAKGVISAPASTILEQDDFNRADEVPILPPWTKYSGGANLELVSNALRGRQSTATDLVYYKADALQHANARAQFRTMLGGGSYPGHGILYRFNPSTGRGIRFLVLGWTTTQIQLAEYLPAFNYLGELTLSSPIAPGDLLEFQIVGTTLTVWKNGTVAATYDRAWSVTEPGICGIAAYDVWNPSAIFLDDYLATAVPDHVGISGGGTVSATIEKGGVAEYLYSQSYLDNFNRADEDPLLPPWREVAAPGFDSLSLYNNAIRAYNPGGYSGLAFYDGTPNLSDYIVRFKVAAYDSGEFVFANPRLMGRGYLSPDGQEWDCVSLMLWKPGSALYVQRYWRVAPFAPSAADIVNVSGIPMANGDVWEMEFSGGTITVRQNGIVRWTGTDAVSGRVSGIGGLGVTDLTAGTPVFLDDFQILVESISSSAISGGGTLAATGKKDPTVDVVLSGGGNLYASVREEAYRAGSISGGGSVTVGIARAARKAASVSGSGAIFLGGFKGGIGTVTLSGGGTLSGTGEVDAGTFVWVLIRGGGELVAAATKHALAQPVLYGGGELTVRSQRSWPYIDLTPPADTDSTALLVLIELDWCGRTFGGSPCLATGTPCYNTWRTCKFITAYQNVGRTYRFCSADFPQVFDNARPYVTSVRWMPTEIKTNLTVNARVVIEMADELDSDVGIDPYWNQRVSHPGTFWKKFLARNVNYKGRTLKVYEGRPGAPESTYVLRWIGKLDNITVKGAKVSIESVDLLKDLSKIEVPPKVNAKLAADVASDYTLGISLTEDAEKFPSSGYVRIDDEIIRYESKDDTTKQLMALSRGQFGTTPEGHTVKTKVQPVRYFAPKSGFDHLLDMVLVDAGIDPVYVDSDSFAWYRDWPDRDIDFTAVVSEPKKLSDLFFEVVDLLDAKAWVAENLKITIRRNVQNAPGRSYHAISDEDDITIHSGSVDLNEKSRITRVSIYWDKVATAKDDESTTYRRLDIAVDPDAEDNYDGVIEKKVLCRWIDPISGEEGKIGRFVQNLGLRRITRQRDAQPLITVELPPKGAEVLTGDYVRLTTDELLDEDGGFITRRIFQVVKRDRKEDKFALTLLQVARRRVCIIGLPGFPDYGGATEAQREYGFITDSKGKMSDNTDGYYVW